MVTDTCTAAAGVVPGSAGATPGGPPPGRPPRRWWRRVLIGLGIVAVLLLLVGGWLVFGGERAEQSSEESARQRVGADQVTTTPTVAGAAALTTPPAGGLYRYAGTGRETTSFPPLTEDQGPQMPATVVPTADGCWQFRVDYNTHHWQQWTYCTAGGQVTERGGTTFSRRSFGGLDVDNTSTFVCDPAAVLVAPGDGPGSTHSRSCTGTGNLVPTPTTAAGTSTVVGPEDRQVGDRTEATLHVRIEGTYQGGQTGTERTDLWVLASSGMPVQNEHHVALSTDTAIGPVDYTEDSSFALQSLDRG